MELSLIGVGLGKSFERGGEGGAFLGVVQQRQQLLRLHLSEGGRGAGCGGGGMRGKARQRYLGGGRPGKNRRQKQGAGGGNGMALKQVHKLLRRLMSVA